MKKGFLTTTSLFLPLLTLAIVKQSVPDKDATPLGTGVGGIGDIIVTIAIWMYIILLALAVVFILLAAFKYLTSGGGEGVAVAHKMLIYAVVAIAVAILAQGIIFVIRELVAPTPAPVPTGVPIFGSSPPVGPVFSPPSGP